MRFVFVRWRFVVIAGASMGACADLYRLPGPCTKIGTPATEDGMGEHLGRVLGPLAQGLPAMVERAMRRDSV